MLLSINESMLHISDSFLSCSFSKHLTIPFQSLKPIFTARSSIMRQRLVIMKTVGTIFCWETRTTVQGSRSGRCGTLNEAGQRALNSVDSWKEKAHSPSVTQQLLLSLADTQKWESLWIDNGLLISYFCLISDCADCVSNEDATITESSVLLLHKDAHSQAPTCFQHAGKGKP